MRPLSIIALCSLVACAAAAGSRGGTAAAPSCSEALTPAVETGLLPGHQVLSVSSPAATSRNYLPTYTRMCGPAAAVVRLDGTSFAIRGGRCSAAEDGYTLQVGMTAAAPAPPSKFLALFLRGARAANRAGTFTTVLPGTGGRRDRSSFARVQLPHRGDLDIAGGAITIANDGRSGTLALRLRDGTRVTGSWTCG